MAYPQGFLFQPSVSLALHSCPSFSSGVILGPRTEELGRSSSGSAFAPYSGSATSPGFNSPLPYGGEPRVAATLSSFMSPAYDPSSGSLDYHPFGALGPYPYGDPAYRKNATRDATATLKAWLQEHRKNPYPTKGEKIMLAIITKMTLTQVSTWFANARRRLKKENKMTWTPRNRSEDEEEDENIDLERNDEDEEQMKMNNEIKKSNETKDEAALRSASEVNVCKLIVREDATNTDFKDCGDRRSSRSTGAPCQSVLESDCRVSREHSDSDQRPTVAPKPKLWSLAEIAMSSDRNRSCSDSSQSPVSPPTSTPRTPFSHGSALPRHLYYTTPFIPGYSSFDPLGPQHGGPGSFKRITSDSAAVTSARDCRRSQSQLEQHELQRGTANV